MSKIQGTCGEAFEPVRKLMQQYIDTGEELGASIFVDWEGKPVIDLWGGFCDENHTRPWTENTITNVWSISKMITNLAALVLVDRGLLNLDENVSTYWPEFGQNGKEAVKVRHILSHTSGVAGWDSPFSTEDMYNLERSTSQLAAQAPWWQPGTALGYHAQSQGHLVGELVRRRTGKSLKQFIAEDICHPLKADFQLGAAEADWARIADVYLSEEPHIASELGSLHPNSPAFKILTGPPLNAAAANTSQWRRAEIGAGNGHGNARSVVQILSTISLGGKAHGVRLLTSKTLDRIFEEQACGLDIIMGGLFRFGIGYGLPCAAVPFIPEGRVCYWGGWGGSIVIMDLDKRLTIGYVMNKMGPGTVGSERTTSYVQSIYEIIRKLES